MRKTPGILLLAIAAALFSPQVRAQQVAVETPQTMLSARNSHTRLHLRQGARRHQGQEALPAGSRRLGPQMQQRHISGHTRARHGGEGQTAAVNE